MCHFFGCNIFIFNNIIIIHFCLYILAQFKRENLLKGTSYLPIEIGQINLELRFIWAIIFSCIIFYLFLLLLFGVILLYLFQRLREFRVSPSYISPEEWKELPNSLDLGNFGTHKVARQFVVSFYFWKFVDFFAKFKISSFQRGYQVIEGLRKIFLTLQQIYIFFSLFFDFLKRNF